MSIRDKSDFASPDEFTVTDSALKLAQAFEVRLIAEAKARGMIVGFDWADSRRVRVPGTNNWEDWGAGFDIAALPLSEIPAQAVISAQGFAYFIRIPLHVRESRHERRIDRLAGGGARVTIT